MLTSICSVNSKRTLSNNICVGGYGTVVGIKNANTDKKERLNLDEVNVNNQCTSSHVYSWYYNVKKEIDNVNKMFGLDIKVRLNQPDQQKGASDNEPEQPDETV